LEARGHSFARYADDCNVYVGSIKAGERVMAYLRRLYAGLKLQINLFPAVEGGESSAKLDWAPLSTDLQESPNG
jgi:hypothetical protein